MIPKGELWVSFQEGVHKMMVQEATQVLSNSPKLVEQTVRLACFLIRL